jgi:CheY-like chemotaxis protein
MSDRQPVLLAEDEEHDVFFMERAFGKAGIVSPLIALPDGREVIAYLKGEGSYSDRRRYPEPRLLLLDLKMPLVDGFEVLSWIRQQPGLRELLPILVLSSSDQPADRERAIKLGAHEYLVKPSDFNSLIVLARELKRRWLDPLNAPPRGAGTARNRA